MANRHGNKQLARAVRARMARTGESYQQARTALLTGHEPERLALSRAEAPQMNADLIPIRYFGVPLALATFEIAGRISVLLLSGPDGRGPFPSNPLLALATACAVH